VTADEALISEARGWRRQLHATPETGFEEHETSAFVAARLAEFGIEMHRGLGGTGVVGVLRFGTSPRAIAFRADMDALNIREANAFDYGSKRPGKMHACGHDGHTAMLLGAARALTRTEGLDGVLYLIFQPAEEHGRGAQAMIADGLFERFPVSEVHGLHNWPHLPAGRLATRIGPLMASEDNFEIRLTGVGGHAARPHQVKDPLVAAAQVITALQTIVARSLSPLESGVVSVTEVLTDGTRNVIPSEVVIKGDTRSFTPKVQAEIETAMRRIAEGVAQACGVTAEVTYTHEFTPLITTADATAAAVRAAGGVFDQVDAHCQPEMASEDCAHLIAACGAGSFVFLGNAPASGEPGVNLHNPHYDFNDDALGYGIRYWLALARDRLGHNV
jgi:hippurate hydrolase